MSDLQSITIGKKLKAYFEEQSISQSVIAERLGVSQPAISALLNGKPFGKNTAKKWAEEFGLKPNWLLTGEGEMIINEGQTPRESTELNLIKDELIASKDALIESLKSHNALLEERVAELKKLNQTLLSSDYGIAHSFSISPVAEEPAGSQAPAVNPDRHKLLQNNQ